MSLRLHQEVYYIRVAAHHRLLAKFKISFPRVSTSHVVYIIDIVIDVRDHNKGAHASTLNGLQKVRKRQFKLLTVNNSIQSEEFEMGNKITTLIKTNK